MGLSIGSRRVAAMGFVLAAFGISAAATSAQQGATGGEWRHYGGDAGSTKYSSLELINAGNVGGLKVVWIGDSPDRTLPEGRAADNSNFENTPLMVGGKLICTTSLCQVAAMNPATGEVLWVFNPESYKTGRPTNFGYVHRGVAYWTDGTLERLYLDTHDAFLWAIDAKTGKAVADFGDGGKIDLAKAIPLAVNARNFTMSSPPVVCRDRVIVGSSITDSAQTKEAPRGDVQAFEARTGKPAWIFHAVPQAGEFGNDTWLDDSWKFTGNTNVWTLMSTDEELGYVYLPFGTPTDDWYGGHRPGDNLFAESLVCLDAKTGQRVWHFQTVHHGLWDYDLPAAPVLCDLKVDGRAIKAVAQITKTGFTWVFDRTNGKPVWPIEERAVPASTVPGEKASPTQPFPTKPAPYDLQGTNEDNLIDYTPELRAEAKVLLDKFEHGPLYTPPSEKGTIGLPGGLGGGNWWGAAFDPDTGLFYVPSITAPIIIKLVKPAGNNSNLSYVRGNGGSDAGPRGLPLFKGPYGRITAINLNTGEHAWMTPHGDGARKKISEVVGRDVGPVGSSSGNTGPLLTKSLLFIAQGVGARGNAGVPNMFRAYDKATGKLLVEVPLPAAPTGTPMTYAVGGKQYVVLPTRDNRLVGLGLEN